MKLLGKLTYIDGWCGGSWRINDIEITKEDITKYTKELFIEINKKKFKVKIIDRNDSDYDHGHTYNYYNFDFSFIVSSDIGNLTINLLSCIRKKIVNIYLDE